MNDNGSGDLIVINEADLARQDFEDVLHKPSVGKELRLGQNVSIVLGVPLNPVDKNYLMPPEKPHLFIADTCFVKDGKYTPEAIVKHPERQIDPNYPDVLDIGKTTILFAHGINRNGS